MSTVRTWNLGVGLLLGLSWFLPWRYQTNDDFMMQWLVSGRYTGDFEYFAVFLHPLISWVFSKLFILQPLFNWYAATWFLFNFIGFSSLNSSLDKLDLSSDIKLMLRTFFLICTLQFSFFLQFTLVAGWLAFAGFTCLSVPFFHVKGQKKEEWVGVFLVGLSLLIRWEASLLLGLSFLGALWVSRKIEFLKMLSTKPFLFIALMGVVFIGTQLYHQSHSEFSDYIHFNRLRASVIDHPVMREKMRLGEFDDSSPYYFFSQWIAAEGELEEQDLIQLKENLDQIRFELPRIKLILETTFITLFSEKFNSGLLIWLAIVGMGILRPKKRFQVLLLGISSLLALSIFLTLPMRVLFLCFLPLLYFFFLEDKPSIRSANYYRLSTGILLGFFLIHAVKFIKGGLEDQEKEKELMSILENSEQGQLQFLEWVTLENYQSLYLRNSSHDVFFMGWVARSPFQQKILQRNQVPSLKEIGAFKVISYLDEPDPQIANFMNRISEDAFELTKTESLQFFEVSYFRRKGGL